MNETRLCLEDTENLKTAAAWLEKMTAKLR
jgi:hypothetical protein